MGIYQKTGSGVDTVSSGLEDTGWISVNSILTYDFSGQLQYRKICSIVHVRGQFRYNTGTPLNTELCSIASLPNSAKTNRNKYHIVAYESSHSSYVVLDIQSNGKIYVRMPTAVKNTAPTTSYYFEFSYMV